MLMLQQMVVLFILMGIGFVCSKKAVITDEVGKKLSTIVVNVANPALILTGCMGEEKIQGQELLITAAVMLAVYAALLLLAQLLPGLLRVGKKSCGTYKAMTVFSNIGFMGFPVVSALYGSGALLYAALFMIPYNILIYTYGVSAMAVKEDSPGQKGGVSFGRIFNMSMMIIGASLASLNLKELFMDGKLLVFSFIKLVVIPVAGVLLIRQFVSSEVICGVCMVMLATPVGSMTAMLAQQYEGDYEMASKGVALTTVLSVVTMPLVAWVVM